MAGLRFRRRAVRLRRRGLAAVRSRAPPGLEALVPPDPGGPGMPVLSDAHRFRRLVAGVCMVLAPLFLLLSAIVHPRAARGGGSRR